MDPRGPRPPSKQRPANDLNHAMEQPLPPKKKSRRRGDSANNKRRCVSSACVACRKRKSKCNGAIPSCAACASVYGTECVYDPNSDHRRKGVYKEKIDSMKAQNSTLQILVEAILNAEEDDVAEVVRKIRTCDSLDALAEAMLKDEATDVEFQDDEGYEEEEDAADIPVEGERDLARKMGELRVENGLLRFIGGTSHLIYIGDPSDVPEDAGVDTYQSHEDPIVSWTEVTKDTQVVIHLINMYFAWHYPYFTTLSKSLFYRDFLKGKPTQARHSGHCSSLLVNTMLALGCHFTSVPGAFATIEDSRTKGDHFFAEAKKLIIENDEYEKPRLTTVQALALMSVREAGCGREAKGWVYSGMSFRMAQDLGLNLETGEIAKGSLNEQEMDARRVTFWGCFLFDKCWSNYLGRLPQLPRSSYSVPKYDVFPDEEAELWSPYTDKGFDPSMKQPARTRAIGLQLSQLGEISSDLLIFFYHPSHIGRSSGKSVELKKLSELHRRLEDWKKDLPAELGPKEGQLPNVILMHMFYHLQYIHLFRPFLRYTPSSSPLPEHVSPRRICTANASAISKLMRLYKKTYNLRQICNIAVYMAHSAVSIHMLNLPERTAKRDVIHGVKQLEEIAEDWIGARRTLSILSVLARKWSIDLPEEASAVLQRTDEKYGTFNTSDVPSPNKGNLVATPSAHSATGSPPAKEELTHLGQFNQTTPPDISQETENNSIPNNMLAAMNMPISVPRGAQDHMARNVPNGGTMGMDEALSWGVPKSASHSIPAYAAHTFSATPSANTPSSSGAASSHPGTSRNLSPNAMYAIDGQDWYLKDGVNWQQSFGTWDMSSPIVTSAASPGYGSNTVPDFHTGPAAANTGDLFTFRGMGDNEVMDGSFDFSTIGGLENLPGLE